MIAEIAGSSIEPLVPLSPLCGDESIVLLEINTLDVDGAE